MGCKRQMARKYRNYTSGSNKMTQSKQTKQKNYGQQGFSLIETTIVIVVMGLIITPIFGLITIEERKRKQVERVEKQKSILTAFSLFVKRNNAYPCPAAPALSPDSDDYGAAMTGTSPGACVVGNGLVEDGGGAGVFIGTVPVKTLGLPLRYIANPSDAKYIYAVTGILTNPSTFNGGGGQITVVDENDQEFLGAGGFTQPKLHFVLVDPGNDYKGAYTKDGTVVVSECTGNKLDVENCDGDAVFRDAPFSNAHISDSFFDDYIEFSVVYEDSTFWIANPDENDAGKMNISNRNIGNIGIGTERPQEKLHVVGGGILVQDEDGGDAGIVESRTEVRSPRFVYK